MLFSLFSKLPFRVKSRKNNLLIKNLKAIKAPILFEGLHSIYPLYKSNFILKIFVRTHNIEHDYFFGLAKSEQNIFKKKFFYAEGKKLKKFENQLNKTDGIFTISPSEQGYFSLLYGKKCEYVPAFHKNKIIENCTKSGDFILYHGDLRISDNVKASLFLIDVYKNTDYKFVIASSLLHKKIISEIKKFKNIKFINISNQNILDNLLKKAHINTLLTFQKNWYKIKTIKLFVSRKAYYCK